MNFLLSILCSLHIFTSWSCPAPQDVFPVVPPPPLIEPSLVTIPEHVQQGEPVKIIIENLGDRNVESISFGNVKLGVFTFEGKSTAVYGFDLKEKISTSTITATLSDGTILKKEFALQKRPLVEAPLGIPEKLGGNTPESEKLLIQTLAQENAKLAALPSTTTVLWSKGFVMPLVNPFVTDDYGYSRQTGSQTISHKGTDFRAAEGTPVIAMNDGRVVMAELTRNYGNAIVIDHGLGIMTMYMHLSKMDAHTGDVVKAGQQIGLSGMTGYADAAHLHLSIRINGVSIDPMKFVELFK